MSKEAPYSIHILGGGSNSKVELSLEKGPRCWTSIPMATDLVPGAAVATVVQLLHPVLGGGSFLITPILPQS